MHLFITVISVEFRSARAALSLGCRILRYTSGFIGSVLIKIIFVTLSLFEGVYVIFKAEVNSRLIIFTAAWDLTCFVEICGLINSFRFWNFIFLNTFFPWLTLLLGRLVDFGFSSTAALTFDKAVLLNLLGNIVIHHHRYNFFHLECVAINSRLDSLFLLRPLHYLFFDSTSGHDSIYSHRLCLTNTMSAVSCLFIHRRVPIVIIEDNCIRSNQIDAKTTSSCRK